jgi:hypothetical protein
VCFSSSSARPCLSRKVNLKKLTLGIALASADIHPAGPDPACRVLSHCVHTRNAQCFLLVLAGL